MSNAIKVTHRLVVAIGVIQLALGVWFWAGHPLALVPLHMTLGSVFVLALSTLAVLAGRSGVPAGLVAATLIWALLIPALRVGQMQLLAGSGHWIVGAAHLLMGVVAMGLASALYARVRAGREAAPVYTTTS